MCQHPLINFLGAAHGILYRGTNLAGRRVVLVAPFSQEAVLVVGVIGERDPDNVKHWRWGYCWEEKIDGDWKNRSIAVPIGAVSLVIGLQNNLVPVEEIVSFIKRSKGKKTKKGT